MSDLKPPSQNNPGGDPARARTAISRAALPVPTRKNFRQTSFIESASDNSWIGVTHAAIEDNCELPDIALVSPIPKFAHSCGRLECELRVRGTSAGRGKRGQ